MRVGLDPSTNAALAGALRLYDRSGTEVRRAINAEGRKHTGWVRAQVTSQARTPLDREMTSTAKVQAGQNLKITMGSTGKVGKTPKKQLVRQIEFGADREKIVAYDQRISGTKTTVRRHTARQLSWRRNSGRLVYRAVPVIVPRVIGAWIRTVADLFDPTKVR